MKYIVYDGTLFPFSEMVTHVGYVDAMCGIHKDGVTSAGFIGMNSEGKLYCHGRSLSLDKVSDPENDNPKLDREFYGDHHDCVVKPYEQIEELSAEIAALKKRLGEE